MFKRKGAPSRGDLVILKVTEVSNTFVKGILEEYENEYIGIIPIDEISYKRIKSLKKYVEVGKKLVCKVLDRDVSGVFNLSLRRVSEGEKLMKLQKIKKEKIAETILQQLAEKLNISMDEIYKNIVQRIYNKGNYLFDVFEEALKEGIKVFTVKYRIRKKYAEPLYEIIKQRIKPKEYYKKGYLYIQSLDPDGIIKIKNLLLDLANKYKVDIKYIAAPQYSFYLKDLEVDSLEHRYKNFLKEFEEKCEKENMLYDFEEVKE